ncbi:glycosyltransferase family 4 protein [Sphingomonas nostoxanthinifaciens]|uniref:glycosyltransferase family 4 protein n=1 Tax=Sphingomonas nostoxanthinifaciens TaxID=2872652 RepID=UPI001CC1F227|nr:glycosyltransferase family 4 protein [Sphingomonas nostoxanthinifaciens]UAK23265.1 glycosyltransferase family 4 protein [Sphingomonas nostoxanthinifaciens]
MRILHLSSLYPPASVGGAERVAASLAEEQVAAGHEVFAASLTREPEPEGIRNGVVTVPLASRNPLWIQESAKYPQSVRLLNKAATVYNIRTVRAFGAVLDRVRPDVVHTHSMVELPPGVWAAAASRGIAVVHTLHDYDLLCIRAAMFKDGRKCVPRHNVCRVLSAPKQARIGAIDVVAAVSRPVLDIHVAHGLFADYGDRSTVVWNPATLAVTATSPKTGWAPFRFGFLGRVVGEKGVAVMIEACRHLPEQGWILDIAGAPGPDQAHFEAAAAGLPIRFVGHVDAAAFLAGIDALVVPPIWDEPFGLTVVEAYAAHRRVVGVESGAIGEMVAAVDPGWTVPPNDPIALGARMAQAMTAQDRPSPERIAALIERLRPANVAAQYVRLYEQAIKHRRG